MAETSILREYLIKLGYQVEESSSRKFDESVSRSAKLVTEFAAAVEAAAGIVELAFSKMADGMEQLYFTAQRSEATISAIKSLGYAVSQLGGTAEGATSALESFGKFLQSSPGAIDVVKGLGIQVKDANGNLRDTGKILTELGPVLRGMSSYRAIAYANLFGIDYHTLMAMRQGTEEFGAQYTEWLREAGVDSDKAGVAAHKFGVELRGVYAVFDILRQKIVLALGNRLGELLTQFRNLIVRNFDVITRSISFFTNGLVDTVEIVNRLIYRLSQAFDSLGPTGRTVVEVFGAILLAWKLLNVGFLASPVGLIIAGLTSILLIFDDFKSWEEGNKHLIDWDRLIPAIKPYWDDIKAFKDFFVGLWPDMGTAVGDFANTLKQTITALSPLLGTFRDGFKEVWSALDDLWHLATDHVTPTFNAFANQLSEGWISAIKAVVPFLQNTLLNTLQSIASTIRLITDVIRGDWTKAWTDATDLVQHVFNIVEGAVDALRRAAPTLARQMFGDPIADQNTEEAQLKEAEGRPGQGAGKRTPADPGPSAEFQSVVDFFRGKGVSAARSIGITTNLEAESGLHPQIWGDNGQAYGLAQMHPDRRAAVEKQFGMRMEDMNTKQQLEAIYWEMFQGPERRAGQALQEGPNEAGAAAAIVDKHYERSRYSATPDGGFGSDAVQRAHLARLRAHEIFASTTPISRMRRGEPIVAETASLPQGYVPSDAGPRLSRMPKLDDAYNRLNIQPPVVPDTGDKNVNINQTNHFNVSGVAAPNAAADEILRGQRRVTGDLARNVPGAVR